MERRDVLKITGLAGLASLLPSMALAREKSEPSVFRYCLNTATIDCQGLKIKEKIDIAARAGYEGVELWTRDIREYLSSGGSPGELSQILNDQGLTCESGIGFAPCLVRDEEKRKEGLKLMQEEMEMLSLLGCKRIAATQMGLEKEDCIDYYGLAQRYRFLLDLGRKTGCMPQLEFWGASEVLNRFSQVLMIASATSDPDARILADVYHMFRGESGFGVLKMISGRMIEIFHMNDYVLSIPREQQKDSDRVFPGDGAAPLKEILTDLKNMGGVKVLSLELFNPEYYKHDPLWIAKTGLEKMKLLTSGI